MPYIYYYTHLSPVHTQCRSSLPDFKALHSGIPVENGPALKMQQDDTVKS